LLKTDKDFNIKTGYIKNVPLQDNPLTFGFQKSKDKILFYYNYIDTIFEISRGYPTPSIVINYGKYRKSREKLSIYKQNNRVLGKPSIHQFSASDNYLKLDLYYPFNNSVYTVLYRISDGKQIIWSELINDLDKGTLDKWAGLLAETDLIFWLMPTTILERFEKMTKSEKLNPKNSEFVEMASKISLESNPVIMICKLK